MNTVKRLLLLGLALLALYMAGRTLKKNTEVIGLLWVLVGMTASLNTANTPKTRALEDRLNALVPAVGAANTLAANALPLTGGTVNGNVTVNGTHNVNGQMNANTMTSSGNANVGGGLTVDGNTQVNGNHNVNGQVNAATLGISGAATSSGFTSHGDVNADNNITAGGSVNTQDLYVSGQRVAPGQGTPGGYPVSGSPSTAGLGTLCNEIIQGMQAAGIFV